MILGMAALVVLLAVGAVALVLTTSHAATGTISAGPRVTDQMPNPSLPTAGPTGAASAPMPRMSGGAAPSITAVASADPIRYLEAVRAQIRTFVAAGPATLDPTTGGDLQNSIIDIENSVVSAQRNGAPRICRRSATRSRSSTAGWASWWARNGFPRWRPTS